MVSCPVLHGEQEKETHESGNTNPVRVICQFSVLFKAKNIVT
jgi:hypothetical protein